MIKKIEDIVRQEYPERAAEKIAELFDDYLYWRVPKKRKIYDKVSKRDEWSRGFNACREKIFRKLESKSKTLKKGE